MVASSDGIVRDGELGIRCTLTEPAVQEEDTFLSERGARKRKSVLSRPQNTLTEPAVQEVPAKRKGRLLTIGKKYDQQEGREVQERESV